MASASLRSLFKLPCSLIPHFSKRTKFTASSAKELINKKYMVNSNPNVKVGNQKLKAKYVQKHFRQLNRENDENDHTEDLFAFHDLTSLEAQMASLKTKGFLRSYKAYSPPKDLIPKFLATCSSALGIPVTEENLDTIVLNSLEDKFLVLSSLASSLGHMVHSSRLQDMTSLKEVLLFYQSEISVLNPYEQLHREKEEDKLPENLVIKFDPIRFTGKGDHPLDQVTAWPRSSTLVTGLATKEKFLPTPAEEDPWEEDDYDKEVAERAEYE